MEEIKGLKFKRIFEILAIILSVVSIGLVSYLLNKTIIDIVKNEIIIIMLDIALVFAIEFDILKDRLLFNNKYFINRYYILYFIFFIISLICAVLPSDGWIYICIFISLALFSSTNIGFISGVQLLTISVLLSDNSGIAYIEYIIPGIIAIMLFSTINNEINVIRPIIISLFFQFLMICICEILLANKEFSFVLFLIPLINIMISFIILIFVLKMVLFTFIYESSDRLLDVIDLEFDLLTQLKNTSKEEYDNSIFTAALCSKIANNIGLSESLIKACGYYYHIGVIRGDNSWEMVNSILNDHDIPQEVIDLLKEYLDENTVVKSKETVVLLIADTVISSIRYLFLKDKDSKIDYDKLINAIIDKKIESGLFDDSKISFEDIKIIKNTLVSEKLFYDFLR